MTRKKTIAVDTWTKVSETDQAVISLFIPNRILDISRGDTVASRDAIQIVIDADDSTPTGDRQDRLVINAVTPYITDLPIPSGESAYARWFSRKRYTDENDYYVISVDGG